VELPPGSYGACGVVLWYGYDLNDTATDPLSIAIARALGLCCDSGIIAVVVSWPPLVLDWNAKVRRKRAS
jgi:hypothetical protein